MEIVMSTHWPINREVIGATRKKRVNMFTWRDFLRPLCVPVWTQNCVPVWTQNCVPCPAVGPSQDGGSTDVELQDLDADRRLWICDVLPDDETTIPIHWLPRRVKKAYFPIGLACVFPWNRWPCLLRSETVTDDGWTCEQCWYFWIDNDG